MHYEANKKFNVQKADALAKFIDSFNTHLIGSYFDIGNHHRYGNMAEWIRTLGHRIQKFDLKGYSRKRADEKGVWKGFCDITDGDVNWAEVRKAIADINYAGWFTAEVGGGNVQRLTKVREQMQKALIG